MTTGDAIKLTESTFKRLQITWGEHERLQEALQILKEVVNNYEAMAAAGRADKPLPKGPIQDSKHQSQVQDDTQNVKSLKDAGGVIERIRVINRESETEAKS